VGCVGHGIISHREAVRGTVAWTVLQLQAVMSALFC